ncbi:hypothetical protein AVEN_220218-1 [Araneus ventricosus]|uniref:C3H1-type domain-containing protein n=1 Tax=Araneus ventricosus TaxID=182803 RepID=A0A4Y2K5N5_ARAVE|nr:hypothetical protein AVEN_220218-1 [Araneus ventricosus]
MGENASAGGDSRHLPAPILWGRFLQRASVPKGYGELLSVKIMPEKYCAFVNYKLKSSPGKAMQAYQGYELSTGYKLYIRFPNLPGEATVKKKPVGAAPDKKLTGPVNGNECYFWRTTGCAHGPNCRYQHIKEHKGIDKK